MYSRKHQAICWDIYPVERETQGWNSHGTVLVDMSGDLGRMSAAFKQRFPSVPGKVVLQDLEGPMSVALSTPGVQNMVHDIFTTQPIKGRPRPSFKRPPYLCSVPPNDPAGARFYYLHDTLHHWPDYQCRLILDNIIVAMSSASRILIDEAVLPDTRVHWQSTSNDLTLMALMGSRERTRTQWALLLDSVGLAIEALRTYVPFSEDSVITVAQKHLGFVGPMG